MFPIRGENALAQVQHLRLFWELAFQTIGKPRHGGADIANHFRIRVIDLLDMGRLATDMDHLGSTGVTHQERRLLDRVMTDRHDEVRKANGFVHIIALRKRRRPHIKV